MCCYCWSLADDCPCNNLQTIEGFNSFNFNSNINPGIGQRFLRRARERVVVKGRGDQGPPSRRRIFYIFMNLLNTSLISVEEGYFLGYLFSVSVSFLPFVFLSGFLPPLMKTFFVFLLTNYIELSLLYKHIYTYTYIYIYIYTLSELYALS